MNDEQLARFRAFLAEKDYPGALEYLARLEAESPGHPVFAYHMGFVWRVAGDFDAAAKEYQRAIALDARFAPAFVGLGIARQLQGNHDEAVSVLEQAARLDPEYVSAWSSLGLTYKKMGSLGAAMAAYRRAQEVLVGAAHRHARGQSSIREAETPTGGRALLVSENHFLLIRKVLQSDVMYATVMNKIGKLYAQMGDREQARRAFLESIEFTPPGSGYRAPIDNLAELQAE